MNGWIRLPLAQVEWLIRGALAAASKDDITPVLTCIHWVVADGRVTVTSTDRYRVHQLHVDAPKNAPDGSFLMQREQASRLLASKHTPRSLYPHQVVDLSWVDGVSEGAPMPRKPDAAAKRRASGSIRFDVFASDSPGAEVISYEGLQVRGIFPPVGRLFPESVETGERSATLVLNPEFLSATRWLRTGRGSLRFTMPTVNDENGEPKKGPSPVLVVNTEGTARALIQPHVATSEWKEYGA